MNLKMTLAIFTIGVSAGMPLAADLTPGTTNTAPSTNTTTIAASTILKPGRYTSTVAPSFNGDMAGRLEKAVGKVQGVESATAMVGDSSIHFTVKKGTHVPISDIQTAVANAYTGAVMTTPILEHSLTANPGL